jgi:hypothetical protein
MRGNRSFRKPARAYLAVIAHDPEGVKRALTGKHL